MKKKQRAVLILLLFINPISCAMSPQIISAISQQANPPASAINNIYNIVSYFTSSFSPSACDYSPQFPSGLQYSESYSQHLQRTCTVERLSNHINDKSLQVSSDSYFYYFKVMGATIECFKKTRILFDDKQVMQELNNIEEYCSPILRQNGYGAWSDELIEGLKEKNLYFNELMHKVMRTQTSWESLKASNIDTFFKWHGKLLKKSKIGMYIHLEVMRRYAEHFSIHNYNEIKLMKHMLNLVISNVKDDKNELELLLHTKSFHNFKDNEAIQKAALARIEELEKKSHQEL